MQGSEKSLKMGYSGIFICTALLVASFLINESRAKVLPASSSDSQPAANELEKRPVAWFKAYPFRVRRSKPVNVQTRIQNLSPGDLEFVDETDDEVRKRFGMLKTKDYHPLNLWKLIRK